MSIKLRIMLRAMRLRMSAGETAEEILNSYPRLSEAEKEVLRKEASA